MGKIYNDFNNFYSPEVLKYVQHPVNMGILKKPSGVGTVGNPVCGDVMKFYIKVEEKSGENGVITDIKFQTLGCGAAIATSSIITKMCKGKSIREVKQVSHQAVVKALKGLPLAKVHCAKLAEKGIKKAIDDYEAKK